MVVDCFTYNGESDLLKIHINVLAPYVDRFIIVEAPTTFSGLPKPLYYERDKRGVAEFAHKIKYFVINENYTDEEIALAERSSNTKGAAHWKHEFLQKESIKKAFTGLEDEDYVFVGDCDEVWNPAIMPPDMMFGGISLDGAPFSPFKSPMPWPITRFQQLVYTYWLNNRSSEPWRGTTAMQYKTLTGQCLNHLRTTARHNLVLGGGWHFTSMGGIDELRRKLEDSYTEETYNSREVQDHLAERVAQNRDFLGRDFQYHTDESEWPQYLKDNREKYAHLCK